MINQLNQNENTSCIKSNNCIYTFNQIGKCDCFSPLYLLDTFCLNGYAGIKMMNVVMVNYFTCSVTIYKTWI